MTQDSEADRLRMMAERFERMAANPDNSRGERERLLKLAAQHREAARPQ